MTFFLEFNFTLSLEIDIINDFLKPNGCDIILGRVADSGLKNAWNWKFSDHIRLGLSPPYIDFDESDIPVFKTGKTCNIKFLVAHQRLGRSRFRRFFEWLETG